MGALRFYMALCVVVVHASGEQYAGLVYGSRSVVEAFFLISGFLVAHVLDGKPEYRSAATFFVSRAIRVYPLYLAILVPSIVGALLFRAQFTEAFQSNSGAFAATLAFANLAIVGQDIVTALGLSGVSVGLHNGLAVPQGWTLSVELAFYGIAPFVLPHRRLVLCLLVVCGLVCWGASLLPETFEEAASRLFFPNLFYLLAGVAVRYWWYEPMLNRPNFRNMSLVVLGIVLALPVVSHRSGAALLLAVAIALPSLVQSRPTRLDRLLGDLCYPLYIVHAAILGFAKSITPAFRNGGIIETGALIALSIVAAYAAMVIVDRPVNRWRKSITGGRGWAPVMPHRRLAHSV